MAAKKKMLVGVKQTAQKQIDQAVNGSFSENALKMMRKRYLLKDEKGKQEMPAEMFHRIAGAIAGVEAKYGKDKATIARFEKDFFDVMTKKEFTPAGRTITNAGGGTRVVANCIVLPIMDSMESIFQTLKDSALLQQAGAGLGFDFSHLRPAYLPTKTSKGVASGPVSFLRVYDSAFGVIKQQGRHGANMAMMRVDHPDVLDFVKCKVKEGDIRNFNISVNVTDEFMKALVERPNTQWYATWNGQKMKPRKVLRAPNGSVIGSEELTITVKELFDEIVHYAWLNGEPGIGFIDAVNRTNPLPGLGPIDSSNPCVTGDTIVATEYGMLPIAELATRYANGALVATDARVTTILATTSLSKETYATLEHSLHAAVAVATRIAPDLLIRMPAHHATRIWKSGIKPVYRLITKSGYELKATADHKIITTEGKIALGKLTSQHRILLQSHEGPFATEQSLPQEAQSIERAYTGKNGRHYSFAFPTLWSKELGQMLGWLIGDGWLRDASHEETVGFTFAESDRSILDYLKPIINKFYGTERNEVRRLNGVYHLMYSARPFISFLKTLGVTTSLAEKKEVPRSLFTAPREAVIGFLQGLFSADGTIGSDDAKGNRYVRFTSKSLTLVKQVQVLLVNLGITSKIYDRSREKRTALFSYRTRAGVDRSYASDGVLYELHVSKQNLSLFLDKIGFLEDKHADKIATLHAHHYYRESFEDRMDSIEYVGEREVFDLSEPITSSFIANGIAISNCGEQFLHHYDVCNLGSLNLAGMMKENTAKTKKVVNPLARIDWKRLEFVTKTSTRMLDNVIDLFDYPVQKVDEMAKKNRRIGLGIMGLADLLYQLGVQYNSAEGVAVAEALMERIQKVAHQTSGELAKEKGIFPNYPLSVYAKKKLKMRNAALTTVAPTGSISMMFDSSSGIEPNFALAYVKQDKDGHQYHYLNRHFEAELKRRGLYNEKLVQEVIAKGSIQHLIDLPEDLRKTFVVSMDLSGDDHIRMQAAFQKHVDNSISKTINFPNSATKDEVTAGYILGWKLGCKSTTVYRDGSRVIQILNLGDGKNIIAPTEAPVKKVDPAPLNIPTDRGKIEPRIRSEVMSGRTYRVKTGYGNLYVTINDDESGAPFEVFATIGKSGGFFQEQSEGICRLISLALRSGIKAEAIIEDLKGIRGPMPVMTDKGTILSLPDAIGQILLEHVKSKSTYANVESSPSVEELAAIKSEVNAKETAHHFAPAQSIADFGMMPGCPDCGAPLKLAEGCMSCTQCGFSRCT